MSHYSQHEGLNSKPVVEATPQHVDMLNTGAIAEAKKILRLRLELVSHVQQLPLVQVPKVAYITSIDNFVELPGPFSIVTPGTQDSDVFNDEVDDVTESESIDEGITPTSSTQSISRPDRFVVRNEFGHVRVQPLIDFIEKHTYAGEDLPELPVSDTLRIGGHCVLPLPVFHQCLEAGVGVKHPLAGRFHPIAGNIIPDTTLLFFGPQTPEEMEQIWGIILHSYHWVSAIGNGSNLNSK
jgi:hypothetical protein